MLYMTSDNGCGGLIPDEVNLSAIADDVVLHHIGELLGVAPRGLSLDANFVSQGGQSLLAMELVSRCRASGLELSVGSVLLADNIREMLSSVTLLDDRIPQTEILEDCDTSNSPTALVSSWKDSLQTDAGDEVGCDSDSDRTVITDNVLLTEMQLSFIHSFINSPGTNVISFYETYRTKDLPAIRTAWDSVIRSESIFRLSLDCADRGIFTELPEAPFNWVETVFETRPEYDAFLEQEPTSTTMDVRFDIVTLAAEGVSTVIWRIHHAFIDGASAQLIYAKFRAALTGKKAPVAGAPFQDVVRRLENYRQTTSTSRQQFWAKQAQKTPQPAHALGLGYTSPEVTDEMDSVTIDIPSEVISARARQLGVTVHSCYQAAWSLVLSLYADSDSVVFGNVLSGRNLPIEGIESTVGPLVNTLPFTVMIDQNMSVAEYVKSVFTYSVELSAVQCSTPDDGFTRQFDTALAMEFEMAPIDSGDIQPIGPSWFRTRPDIPLSIYINHKGRIRLCFQKQRYLRRDVEVLAEHLKESITRLCSSSSGSVGDIMRSLPILDSRKTLIAFGNCAVETTSAASVTEDLVTLFEKVARQNATTIAIEKSSRSVTYADLDSMASVLASQLIREYAVAPGDVVCVHADRSVNWIVAIMGILKAGAVYCALDIALPPQVRDDNYQTAAAKLFITPLTSQKDVKPHSCDSCLSVEELIKDVDEAATGLEHRASARPGDNAYLCFTSGSTGKPKGVMCHHAGLVAFQSNPDVRFFACPGRRISQLMSPAFDGSIHEIFSALCYGATLVLSDEDGNPFSHLRKVDAAIFTPSIAKILDPSEHADLKTVYCVGEPMPQYVSDSWSRDPSRSLFNMYGPTEATCGATTQRLLPGKKVTIGKPNATMRIYILDRNQRLLPAGVVGEIYCAGIQVARGYIGRPDLTAERFLPDTICDRPGEVMYRTGDRGFFNADGEVECLGRDDRQIKLRGFRLDLNDLEIRVARAVEGATAVAICASGDFLVCMLQPATLNVTAVGAAAREVLHVHALPRYFVPVDGFPLTRAGKIDYKEVARQCITSQAQMGAANKKPMTDSELALAKVWRETLSLPTSTELNGSSNFIALGGHSVMQMQLSNRLARIHGIQNPLRLLLQSPTLADLAAVIDKIKFRQVAARPICEIKPLGSHMASPIEQDWWRKYGLGLRGTSSFNVTYACAIDPEVIDIKRLVRAWNTVLARHRIFRSRFIPCPCPDTAVIVHRLVTRYAPRVKSLRGGRDFDLWREVNRTFRLDCDENLIRVLVSETKMLLVVSHILADLTTLETLLRELATVYKGGAKLGPVKRTYEETVRWSQPILPSQKSWWRTNLAGSNRDYGIPEPLRVHRESYGGRSRFAKLDAQLSKRVILFSEENKITLHQLALASVAMAMQLHRDDTDIVLGAPYLNRDAEDMETVGLFLEPLPIRIKYDGSKAMSDAGDFIFGVQKASREAVSRAIPWHHIVDATRADKDTTRQYPNHPLLDIMVTFHDNRTTNERHLQNIQGLEPVITYTKGSKFLLLVEFCAIADGYILLRLEYDDKCISQYEIMRIQTLIIEGMAMITRGWSYPTIKQSLRNISTEKRMEFGQRKAVDSFFGTRVNKLLEQKE